MEEGIRFERMTGLAVEHFKCSCLSLSHNPPKYGRRESNPQRADFKSDASAVPPLPHKYPDRDSNPDKVNQNHLCYRYTIGVKKTAKGLPPFSVLVLWRRPTGLTASRQRRKRLDNQYLRLV